MPFLPVISSYFCGFVAADRSLGFLGYDAQFSVVERTDCPSELITSMCGNFVIYLAGSCVGDLGQSHTFR